MIIPPPPLYERGVRFFPFGKKGDGWGDKILLDFFESHGGKPGVADVTVLSLRIR